jgi:hypothetical protein
MTEKESILKMAIIAGAAHAMKYKTQNPNANESEVLKHVNSEMKEILNKIDKGI